MQSYRNTLLSLLAVILAAVGVILAWNDLHRNKQKVEALRTQLAHAQIEPLIQRDTIRDTVQVATSSAIPVERRTYKNELADKQLIKDLRLRLSQIETQQLSGTAILDTVRLTSLTADSYEYADRWTHFKLSMKPPDTTLVYTVSDSVLTLVYREYKHKFLWWRWGTKGYKVKVVNFNPHATIRYNQYIKVE
ncbi:MAG: hypothetical protein PUG09_11895 [Prevotella sp.]|nr:hypothetical protein [Prevotella sp.]